MAAPNLEPSRNVIELLRVSGDKQDVLRQRADLAKNNRKFNLRPIRTVELNGVSGTATLTDEQVQQILAQMEDPAVDGINISALDRLFRPAKDYRQWGILQPFVEHHKLIWSTREGEVNPEDDNGYDKCMAAGTRAGAEWREIRRRSNDQRRELAEAGIMPHGNVKFGWDIIGRKQTGMLRQGKAVLNEYEAPIAREMFFRAYRNGMHTYEIAAKLNALGIRNKRGFNGQDPKQWSTTTVLQILRSTDYIGKHYWQGILIPIDPIVDEELFYAVQEMMAANKTGHAGRPSKLHLLRRFLWCSLCGCRMGGRGNGKKRRRSYRCTNVTHFPPRKRLCHACQIGAEILEEGSWSEIWGLLKAPKVLLEMGRSHLAAQAKPHLNAAQEIEQELARLRQRERNLDRMMKEARNDKEYDECRTERNAIRVEIASKEVELRTSGKVVNLPPLDLLQAQVERITSGPEPKTYEERRPILEGLLDLRIEWGHGEMTITGKVPMSELPQNVTNSYSSVDGYSNLSRTSFQAIPFILKRRVA